MESLYIKLLLSHQIPDEQTFSILLKACHRCTEDKICRNEKIERACHWFDEAFKRKVDIDYMLVTSLGNIIGERKAIEVARSYDSVSSGLIL